MAHGEGVAGVEASLLYLEDFEPGQRFETGTYRLDLAAVQAFAQEFDPQPFHLDPEAAKGSFFGELVASGWHTAAATMRLLVDTGLPIAGGLIGAGGEIKWPAAAKPGDELKVFGEVVEVAASRSRPDRGFITVTCETRNQRGDVVQVMTARLLAFRRKGG